MDLMERNFLNSTRITSSHLSSIYGKNKKEGIQAIYFGEVMLNGTNSDWFNWFKFQIHSVEHYWILLINNNKKIYISLNIKEKDKNLSD